MLSIASAVLGFGLYPEPDTAECTGHTGDLYSFAQGSFGCESVAPGYDPDAPWSCDHTDGNDNYLMFTAGDTAFNATGNEEPAFAGYNYGINTKDVCPETCGVPCAHAPTEDAEDGFMMGLFGLSCADLAAYGYCEWTAAGHLSGGLINWMCGASCGGYDECSLPSGFEFATSQCPYLVASTRCGDSGLHQHVLHNPGGVRDRHPELGFGDSGGLPVHRGPERPGLRSGSGGQGLHRDLQLPRLIQRESWIAHPLQRIRLLTWMLAQKMQRRRGRCRGQRGVESVCMQKSWHFFCLRVCGYNITRKLHTL